MVVTLREIKQHLNIEATDHNDDEYLLDLIQVAEENAESYINVALSTFSPVPASIKQAIKIRVAHLYDVDRMEAHNLKPTAIFHRLLSAYVNYNPTLT